MGTLSPLLGAFIPSNEIALGEFYFFSCRSCIVRVKEATIRIYTKLLLITAHFRGELLHPDMFQYFSDNKNRLNFHLSR